MTTKQSKQVGIRLDDETIKRLTFEANKRGMTFSQLGRAIFANWLQPGTVKL